MASSTDEFAARARSIFDALGSPEASGWKLDTQQGFRPGADDGQDSSAEEEGAGPQPLEGAAGSDEEGVEEANQYRVNASCAYVRAFEQEEEEDEFDRQAAGSGDEGSRPLRSMEVLEDNAFDRMHSQQYSQQHRGMLRAEQQQQADISEPSPAAAGNSAAAGAAPAAMDIDEDLPALEPTPAPPAPTKNVQQGPLQQDAGQVAEQQQQQQHPTKRPRTGFGQVWVPPHRRPDSKPAGEPAQAQQHNNQQQQQQRRVRFADGGPGQQQQQQQDRSWVGGNQSRGRGRGSFVPDHVRNPHKYTVYTLDEPLYVGQGGGDDRDNERAAAAAGLLGGQAAASRSSSSSSSRDRAATGVAGSVPQQEPAGSWMHEDAPVLLDAPQIVRPSVHAATVTGDGDTTAPVQLPTAGAIKFQPSGKRNCGDAVGSQPASKTVAAANAVSANVAKQLNAFADDEEPGVVAFAPPAVQKSSKSSRHYRTKHGGDEDA